LFAGEPDPGEGDLFGVFQRRGLDVVRVGGLRRGLGLGDLFVRRRLARELAAFAPDVVHTHASKAGALGRSALRGASFARTARVHTFHGHVLEGYFPALVARRLVAVERRLAEVTDRIVAVSHATADDLVRLGVAREEQLVVIQPGLELGELLALDLERRSAGATLLRASLGVRAEDFLVGVVGRLAEVKQPLVALEVFALLAPRHPDLAVAFVGDGELRGVLTHAIQALPEGVRARVHLLGAREDISLVLGALDALLLASRSEGLPVALIEAAAAGLPVVARAVGGVGELVVDGRTGYLAADTNELAFGLERLLGARGAARAMGARARLRVAQVHSAETLARRLAELYELVCVERGGRQ
jgi:glycosyltransferase involved in cell wall biosynthesis